jgi:Replication-relaxation
MSVVFRESSERALLSSVDVGLLSVRDRACLRLLYRAGVATADQLATLIFPSRRTALRRLRRLWQLGLLERAPLAPERGGIPVAYRITRRGSKRLGYHDTRTGGVSRIRHSLDIVDAVGALVRSAQGSVQVWLTEPMTEGVLPADVQPDSVVVLQVDGGSAVLCLEIDEATEHSPTIRARLGAYERALAGRAGWHVLWVVPTEERLAWFRRVGRWDERPGLEGCSWGLVLAELRAAGLWARTQPVGWSGEAVSLEAVIANPRPRGCPTPVGSPAWIRLLGSGGAEETDEALA